MTKYLLTITISSILLTSCFHITYNKSRFKKFDPIQSQNDLIRKNGYYFYETEIYRYDNYIKSSKSNEFFPTDSILKKSITGMIFYKKNSLKIAQSNLEKRIDTYDLKTIDEKENHISTLGKYSLQNDTITIQYFRFSQGDRYLTQLKGTLIDDNSFNIFQRIDYYNSLFKKPKLEVENITYSFNKYNN